MHEQLLLIVYTELSQTLTLNQHSSKHLQSGTKVVETLPKIKSFPFKRNLSYLQSSYLVPSPLSGVVTMQQSHQRNIDWGVEGLAADEKDVFFIKGSPLLCQKAFEFLKCLNTFVPDCSSVWTNFFQPHSYIFYRLRFSVSTCKVIPEDNYFSELHGETLPSASLCFPKVWVLQLTSSC